MKKIAVTPLFPKAFRFKKSISFSLTCNIELEGQTSVRIDAQGTTKQTSFEFPGMISIPDTVDITNQKAVERYVAKYLSIRYHNDFEDGKQSVLFEPSLRNGCRSKAFDAQRVPLLEFGRNDYTLN